MYFRSAAGIVGYDSGLAPKLYPAVLLAMRWHLAVWQESTIMQLGLVK